LLELIVARFSFNTAFRSISQATKRQTKYLTTKKRRLPDWGSLYA
jgi:hypothetical protein